MGANIPAPAGGPLAGRQPLTYMGQRVLTTELAARAFGVPEGQLRDNASANAVRFEAGKHFYKVEGAELRALKHSAGFTGSVGANARIAANRVTKRGTGFDVLAEMGITHLVAPVNDPLVIPTKLGQDLGGLTPREVNKLLARLGYQWADKDHRDRNLWRPTPKGEALGAQLMDRERSNDTGAAQQLMWPLAATLEVLRAGLRDDAGDDGEAA